MITTVSITMKSFVVETAKYLHEKCGYDVTLICDTDEQFASSLPQYLHYIPVHMSRGVNLSGLKAIKELKKIFKKEKFDLVQYSTPNASFYASIAAKSAKIPIRLYCQWGIRYVGFGGIKRQIFKFLEKIVCRKSTNIFAVSQLNKKFAIDEKLYVEKKAKVVGNGGTIGVDMCEYNIDKKSQWRSEIRDRYNIGLEETVFGFVGRVSSNKGCVELLESFRRVIEKHKKTKLLIVGPVEEKSGIGEELFKWARENDKIIFTGSVSNSEVKKYYSAMDVLVHPTYREGFGMVIQEAGALAVPTITTKIPGASEVMVDNESCLLVEPRNIDDLEKALVSLCEMEYKIKELGKEAYKRTAMLYERQIMLENQRKEYQNLLGD